jgi:osmotically-inducible protein OsmY
MNSRFAITLVITMFIAPTGGYAAEKATTPKVEEEVSDSSVTTKIKSEFAKDNVVNATNIKVDTEDKGIVTLGGQAKTREEADRAVKIARETSGVISVKNNIAVGESSKRSATESVKNDLSDAVITTRIKSEFAKDKMVSATRVKVETDDKGVVTLSGTAKSKAEADQAVKLARNTKGVTSVKNDISVESK